MLLPGQLGSPANTAVEFAMPLFTVDEVLELTGARLLTTGRSRTLRRGIRRICTDSRLVRQGDLFVALKGDRFDGHEFVDSAMRQRVIGALVKDRYRSPTVPSSQEKSPPLLLGVPDTLVAFQQLAAHHRNRFQIPVVAVTGSNGKTTTKDMVAHVLAERWSVLKTEGNLNNRIGVPQTLFRLNGKHEVAVIEMGVDQKGQTTRLCEMARPTIGLITNIGPDHLEFFGSLDVSAEAKGELLDALPAEGAAILNADDAYFEYLASRAPCRVLSFGVSENAHVRAEEVATHPQRGLTFQLRVPGRARSQRVSLQTYGTHNLLNALAAAAVGHLLGISGAAIAHGLARFRPVTMRSQVSVWEGLTIINDSYNANPASMKAAIDLLTELGTGKRTIAVLGNMLELGPNTMALHRDVGTYLAQRGISRLIACGDLAGGMVEGARLAGMAPERVHQVADVGEAASVLRSFAGEGDVILLKASRGVQMEKVLEILKGRDR